MAPIAPASRAVARRMRSGCATGAESSGTCNKVTRPRRCGTKLTDMSSTSFRGALLASACALVAALALLVPSRANSESAASASRPVQAGYLDAGIQHTCAILADHTLRCWGKGLAGRLGYG